MNYRRSYVVECLRWVVLAWVVVLLLPLLLVFGLFFWWWELTNKRASAKFWNSVYNPYGD